MGNCATVKIEVNLPRTLSEDSENEITHSGHSHEIEKASTLKAGIVKLNDTLDSLSKDEALTANQGRELAERIEEVLSASEVGSINKTLDAALAVLATRYTSAYATHETAKDNLCKHPENSLIYVVNDPTMGNNGLWTVVGGELVKAPWDALRSALTSEPFEVLQSIFQGAAGEKIEYEGKTYDTLATFVQTLAEGKAYIQDVLIDLAQSNNFTASYLLTESGKFQEEVNEDVQASLGDIYEHGAALPYKEDIAYGENAVVVKDGELQQWKSGVWRSVVAERLSDTVQTFNTPEAGVDSITGVVDGAYFNVRSVSDESYTDEYQNVGGAAVATGKRCLSSLGVQLQEKTASTIKDASGKSQQEINNKTYGKFLSQYGAIPDSIEHAAHNETCLINAIKSGDVLVDGYYYIECSSTETIVNSFRISSPHGNKGTLDFSNPPAAHWLKLGSIEYFDTINVDIKTPLSERGRLFTIDNNLVNIGRIKVKGCSFSSRAMYFYATFSATVDPSVTRYGVRNVHVTDNEFYNPHSFFFTINMPHDFVEVKRNKVRNLSERFFNVSIGTHAFDQKLKDVTLLAECTGNTVKNDLGFLATDIDSYLTFFLYESGGHLEYTGNLVSGLCSEENVVVYDCYANVKTLKHEGNTWRNNLCIHVNKGANTLLKSKSAIKAEYFNNKYYVDYGFISYHGAIAQSVVQIYTVDSVVATNDRQCIMRENTFDVYHLIGQTTTQATKNIVFEDNRIRAFNVSGYLFNVRRNAAGITDLSDAKIRIKRNDIDVKNIGMDVTAFSANVRGFGLVAMSTTPSDFGRYKEISVSDNTIKAKTAHGTVSFYSILEADYIDISNNEIAIEELATASNFIPYEYNTFIYDDLKADNCMIKVRGSAVIPIRSTAGNLSGNGKARYSIVLDALFNGNTISVKKPVGSSSFVKVELNSLSIAGLQSASYLLKLTPYYVEYLASDDTQKSVNYPTSGLTNITDLKVFKIQEVDTLMANLGLTLSATRGDVAINLRHTGLVSDTTDVHYRASVDVFPF